MNHIGEPGYSVHVHCSNCGYDGEVNLSKGHPVEMASCPKCGCRSLSVSTMPQRHYGKPKIWTCKEPENATKRFEMKA